MEDEDMLEEEEDAATEPALEADELAAAEDCNNDALSEGLLLVAGSEGRTLVVACRRSALGASCPPMLVCTSSPKLVRTRSHRLCIFVARCGIERCLQARWSFSIEQSHVFVRSGGVHVYRNSLLRCELQK
jgi:hypothetical protein